MNGIVKSAANSAKQQAISQAKAIASEPVEILKTAHKQIIPELNSFQKSSKTAPNEKSQETVNENEIKRNDTARLSQLESEVKQLQISNLVTSLQRKISQGEVVYLEEYPQIPIEQKQVLKAHMEAYKSKIENEKRQENQVQVPTSKPGRRIQGMAGAMKKKLTDLSRKSEIRMPPSG